MRRWHGLRQPHGRYLQVPPAPIPVPVWIPPHITPARRATHPYIHRGHYTWAPLGNYGTRETLWRFAPPSNGWQFGPPSTT